MRICKFASVMFLASLVGVCTGQHADAQPKESIISAEAVKEWEQKRAVHLFGGDQDLKFNIFGRHLLVKARTVGRDDERERIATWMKIEEVYYGPANLKAKIFKISSLKQVSEGLGPFDVFPAPESKDVGIWLLRFSEKNEGTLSSYSTGGSKVRGVLLPAFQRQGEHYKTALSFAKSVHRVAKLPSRASQLARLKELAFSKTPEISRWAVFVLSDQMGDRSDDFLKGLIANPKSTIAGQIAADTALLKQNQENWQHSERRLKMLKNWVNRKSTNGEAQEIAWRISSMVQNLSRSGVAKTKMLELLRDAVLNQKMVLGIRCQFTRMYGEFPKSEKDDQVFEALANLVTRSPDEPVKLRSARALVVMFELDSARRIRVLRDLMESETSGSGGKLLHSYKDWDSVE